MDKEEWFDKYLSQANQDIQYCEEHHCLKEFVASLLENNNAKNEIIKLQEKAQLSLQNELTKIQLRIEKAIEYIKKEELDVNADEGMTDYSGCFSHIIKILKGDSNE